MLRAMGGTFVGVGIVGRWGGCVECSEGVERAAIDLAKSDSTLAGQRRNGFSESNFCGGCGVGTFEEPTNNESERTLRHAVIYRHICLGTQSEAGSRFVERILTVEASLRRQQRDMLQFLTDACQAALLDSAPPSLIPTQHTPTSLLAAA